jgi:hypothetical protein
MRPDDCGGGLVKKGAPQAHLRSFCREKTEAQFEKNCTNQTNDLCVVSMTKGKMPGNLLEETNKFIDGVKHICLVHSFISFCA